MDALYTIILPRTKQDVVRISEIFWALIFLRSVISILFPMEYGRYANIPSFTKWTVSGKTAWRCFMTTWITPLLVALLTPSELLHNPLNVIAVGLYIMHYFQRSVVGPAISLNNASPQPLSVAVNWFVAGIGLGFTQSFQLLNVHRINTFGILGFLGLVLNLVGFSINVYHDKLLADLRKTKSEKKDDKAPKYSIPRGGLFEYVSAANYFGEIVEWCGFALFTGGSLQILLAMSTIGYIGVRGWAYHNYYKETFGKSYPPQRKAVIPFIF